MEAPDEQQRLLRSHFERSAGCLRKQYRVFIVSLNVLLICLVIWIISTGAFHILISVLSIPIWGVSPSSPITWNSYVIAIVLHSVYVILACGGFALWVSIALNLKPPVELRLAFTDSVLAAEYYGFLRKTIIPIVYAYIIYPQIALLVMRVATAVALSSTKQEVHISWLLIPVNFIMIVLLMIDAAVAVAVGLKDRLLQTLAWSATAIITYALWWLFRKIWQYALVYMVNSLEWTYLADIFVDGSTLLLLVLIIRGKMELATYSMRCARNTIADAG